MLATGAVVSLSQIASNFRAIRKLAGSGVTVMPVVKANAYGHGLGRVFPGFQNADALAILEIEGAAMLRASGWTKPIVLLEGCFDDADLNRAMKIARRVRTGTMSVNGGMSISGDIPFGGYKASGIGREWGVEGIEEYLETKLIAWRE